MSQLHAFFRWFRFVGTLVSFSTLLHLHGASALGKNSFAYFAFEQERTMHEHVLDILHYPRQETHILLGEQQWLLQVTKKKLQNSLGVIPEYTSLKYAFDEAAQDILNLKILCSKDVYLGSERMKKELILRNPQNQENVCGEYDYWYTTFAKKRDDAKRDLMAEYEKIVARHRELEILVRGMGRYRAYSSKTATAYFVTDFDEHEKLQSFTEKIAQHLLESLNEATTHGGTSPSRVDAALEYICSEQPEAHTQILHICPKSITHEVLTLRNLEWTYKQIDFVTNLEYWTASDLNALTNYFQKVIAEEERQHAAWQLPADHAAFIKLYTSPHILFMGEDQIRNKGLIQIVQEIMTGQQNPSDLFKDTEISYADSGDPLLELHIMLAHLRNADEHRKNIRLLRIVGERLFQEIEQRRTMLGIIGGTYLLDVKTDSWSKVQLVLDLTKLNFIYDISRQIIDAIPTSVHVMDAIHQVLGATFSLPQDASFPTERDIQLHQQLSKAELHTFRCMQQVEHATNSRSLIINDEDMFSALSDTMEVRMSSQIEPEGIYRRQRNAIEACRRFLEHVILIHVDIMTEDRKSAEGFEYSTKTASLKKRKQLHVISGIVHEFLHNFEHETDSGQLLHYEAFFKTWFSDRSEALNALRQELSLEPKPLLIFSGKLESDNYHEMQRIRMHTALQEALVSHQSLDDYTLHAKIGELEWLIYSSIPRSVARLPDKNAQMNESVKDWFIDIKAVISALVKQYKHDDPSSFQQLVASDGIIKMYESKFSPFRLLSKLRSKDGTILKRIHGRLLGILSSFKETALSTDRESLLLGRTQLIEFLKAELYTRMQYQTAVVLEQPGENAQSKLEIIMYDTCGVRESHHDDEELCPSGVVQTFMELRSMEHELARSNFILELNALSTAELEALRSHVIYVIDGLGMPIDEAEFAKQQLAALEKYEQLIRELSSLYRMRNDEVSQHGGSSDEVQNLTQKINALEAEQLKMLRQAASTDISFENPIHRGLLSGYTHPAQDYQVAKFDIEQIIMHRKFENELILKHHTLIQIRLKREVMQLRTELGLFHNQSIMQDATSLQTIRVEVHNLVAARRMLSELYEQEKLISSSDDFDTFRAHYHARHDEVYQKCAARLSAIPRNLLATETEGSMRTLLSVIRRTHALLQACMNQKLKNDYTRVCMEDAIPHWLLHSWFWNSIGEAAALLHTQKQCEEEFELVDGVYRLIEERYLAYCSVEQTDPPKAFSLNILQRIFLSEIHRTLRALYIDVPGDGEVAAPSEVSSGVPRWVIALLIIFSFMIVTSILVLILIHVRRSRSLSHRALNSKIIPVSDSAYESLYEMQES